MIKKLLTTLVIFAVFYSKTTLAVEYQSPRVLSLGGSGRAAPILNDAIYQNPAYASFVQTYALSVGYVWFDQGRNYNLAIQDSRTDLLQAGIGFTRREQGAAFNIGASKAVIDRLGVGIGTKILVDDVTRNTTTDFLFSTSFIAMDNLYSALIIDNLFENANKRAHNLYRNFFLAFKYVPLREIQVYLDTMYSPNYEGGNKGGYSVGAEFAMMADFYLRAGKYTDAEVTYMNNRGNGWSLGLGWIGPKVDFEYAFHRFVSGNGNAPLATAHATSMSIFF